MSTNFAYSRSSRLAGMSAYLLTIFLFFALATGASAFGAGTTSSDECKWRHGDIENALLGLMLARTAGGTAFTRMDVKRVYFGNWLRDYSQIMDVGFLKVVGPNVLRTMVALFAFMTFGYGTGEFEVSDSRLGVYRPEEHIDNPKHYANNIDAKKYDDRLRGVVDEDLELFPDDRTGMKGYIANERLGLTTSAWYVRKALGRCIKLGRQHAKKKNIKDFDDALRHLGAALHALEDFPAHSNYVELCLRELGERGVFPHVGTATEVEVKKDQVFPLVTGSFGSVHFLSNVVGGDPMNSNPSELQLLEEQITSALEADSQHGGEINLIKEHFASLPKGLLNEQSIANLDLLEEKSKEKQEQVKTRADDGEPVDLDTTDLYDQIYPLLEMHDRVVREIVYGMEEVPTHAATYEKIQESVSIVTFALIAPYILPVLQQARIELAESANEMIAIASDKEGEVFSDPYCSDPVHTVISKDNAANVLSEPAGRIAVEIVKFVVPLIMRAWDEPEMDMDPLINYILGVFHHPVCRDERNHRGQAAMFAIVRDWWTLKSDDEKDELRGMLSMDGIKENKNHQGHDTGHGCLKPIAGAGVKPGDATGTIFTRKPDENDAAVPDAGVEKAPEPPQDSNMGSAGAHKALRNESENTAPDDDIMMISAEMLHQSWTMARSLETLNDDIEVTLELVRMTLTENGTIIIDTVTSQQSVESLEMKNQKNQEGPASARCLLKASTILALEAARHLLNLLGTKSMGPQTRDEEPVPPVPAIEPPPLPPDSPAAPPVEVPDTIEEDASPVDPPAEPPAESPPEPPAEAEGDGGSDKKVSRRRSTRKREGHRNRKEPGEAPPIPEEDVDYFQPPHHHHEHELRDARPKASKVLGVDVPDANGDNFHKARPKRRHTEREIGERRKYEDTPPARGGLFGRIVSRADKLLGRDAIDGGSPRPLERRRTTEHNERRRHHSHDDEERRRRHDDEERRRRKHRSVTLPVQIDPPDFAEAPPAPDDNGTPVIAEPEQESLNAPEDRKNRRQKSSPNTLQFDVPSDGSGSGERKKSRSPRRPRDSTGMPELQDVSGLGIDTGDASESRSHRRRHRRDREVEDTPTPSPKKERRISKRGVKEVNFEDAVESSEPRKEKSRRHRSARDESREEGEGSRERRRRTERKRESAVFGGYDIRD
ncbi:hypothetical protein ABW21_db0207808 [Orbilia brochopaga]|nr:hypothetical protein ABW21_db0207808 [Drechslerella brochopaga]